MKKTSWVRTVLAGMAVAVPCSTGFGLSIVFNDLGGVGAGSQAEAGFKAAAARWEALLSDPVSIRMDVGFSSFGAGMSTVIGGADSETVGTFVWRC